MNWLELENLSKIFSKKYSIWFTFKKIYDII
nr:MAG TPA: hypothetical protein [Caudoviricetes sp.]